MFALVGADWPSFVGNGHRMGTDIYREATMIYIAAILFGALISSHPALAVVVLLYAGTKLHESEALLFCCSGYPTRTVIVYGRANTGKAASAERDLRWRNRLHRPLSERKSHLSSLIASELRSNCPLRSEHQMRDPCAVATTGAAATLLRPCKSQPSDSRWNTLLCIFL
jgi:hypothetical protein